MNLPKKSIKKHLNYKITGLLLLLAFLTFRIANMIIDPDPIVLNAALQHFHDLIPIRPSEVLLKEKMAAGLPLWAQQQIQEDLATFSTIKRADLGNYLLESYLKEPNENKLVRFEIKNNKIKVSYYQEGRNKAFKKEIENREKAIFNMLSYLLEKGYISETDFIVNLEDCHYSSDQNLKPVFVFAKDNNVSLEKKLILMPDPMNLNTVLDLSKRIRNAHQLYPWGKKQDKLFWRGGPADSTGFRKKLVAFSRLNPQKVDASFSNFTEPEEHLKYKYLITIDGERCSWTRFVWQLHSNSLNFKHQSTQTQWFYKGISPYIHYIPIKDEPSILTAIDWAENHPKEVNEIIQNAMTFSQQNLTLEDMYHYTAVLLQEYSKKLR